MMFREQAYVLTGERCSVPTERAPNCPFSGLRAIWLLRRHSMRIGQPHCVEANWNWALQREEARGDVLGFGHTHPPRAGVTPSLRDVRTMQAWCLSLGKPLLCVIECEGRMLSTQFRDEDDVGRALPLTRLFARGVIVVLEGDDDNQSA